MTRAPPPAFPRNPRAILRRVSRVRTHMAMQRLVEVFWCDAPITTPPAERPPSSWLRPRPRPMPPDRRRRPSRLETGQTRRRGRARPRARTGRRGAPLVFRGRSGPGIRAWTSQRSPWPVPVAWRGRALMDCRGQGPYGGSVCPEPTRRRARDGRPSVTELRAGFQDARQRTKSAVFLCVSHERSGSDVQVE